MKSYNTSVTNFDRSVVPQGRKFAGLAIGDEDEMEGTAPTIDSATTPRRVSGASGPEGPEPSVGRSLAGSTQGDAGQQVLVQAKAIAEVVVDGQVTLPEDLLVSHSQKATTGDAGLVYHQQLQEPAEIEIWSGFPRSADWR